MNGVAIILALGLVGPPVLPPLPGERVFEPEAAPEPEPAPAPKPAPKPAREKKSAPTTTSTSTSTSTSTLAAATEAELAQLEADDRLGARGERVGEPKQEGGVTPGDRPHALPETTLVRTAEPDTPPPLTYKPRRDKPRRTASFVFGYRTFAIRDAFGRPQSWHVGSVEVSPLRRWVRLDLITEIGGEGGAAARDGDKADLMLVQKAGLGVQYPGWLTPFLAFQGGVGGARVELFDRNDLLFVYTLGIDAGAQWAATRWLFVHVALGWIHPTFRRPERSVRYDAFTFKVGIGF